MGAHTVCKAIESFWEEGTIDSRVQALQEYETEMIQRAGEEVRLSEANSVAVHDWKARLGKVRRLRRE